MGVRDKLNQKKVEAARRPGKYADGGGLYLQVREAVGGGVNQSWIFRYRIAGVTLTKAGKITSREMGLGPVDTIGLAEARERARKARALVLDGKDPAAERDAAKAEKVAASGRIRTFRQCAEDYMRGSARKEWNNPKHIGQWEQTLRDYAYPKIGELAVDRIDTEHVLRVLEQPINVGTAKRPQLEPFWTAKAETASRLRGRMEHILAWAKQRKLRAGDNPAAWDNLRYALPTVSRLKRIKHHAALPFQEVPAFLGALRDQEGIAPRALEFAILTAGRTGEIIGARWEEIDLDAKVWTVPGERMKAGKEHRVPLSPRALEILEELRDLEDSAGFVFPGRSGGQGLSNMAMLAMLRRMKRADLTVHGFRSSFRDWAAECTTFPNFVVEMALAHTIGDKVEAAYRRGDLFKKRQQLMEAWAAFVTKEPATVTAIDTKRRSAA